MAELESWATKIGAEDVMNLDKHMDFRDPLYRREVFLRFYEFSLRYRTHPGGVYYLFDFLAHRNGWTQEELEIRILWKQARFSIQLIRQNLMR